ncbi:ribose-5-phosphate isomerase RpiA [Lignipirellula cremea]|uniref:Ribose-5-phosphate isomerase A n=1 Tax=Lignipirellula cremea TaxID=2528010 RepID=A0A518DQW4_9BACT|nr:ribose-5-phosphate isomerase RpiA [Lignipirellula cremea]QDU94219.1 Ribose-5-phosphate isomerase A [Lignipirellula cremea]
MTTPDYEAEKRQAAARSLDYIRPGMRLGLGSGSTARFLVDLLAKRVQAGLQVQCVATSETTHGWAEQAGLPLTTLDETPELDLTIDGADEADRQRNLIKGGGGALLREKIVAGASRQMIVIADSRKLVDQLGAFPLPVEVVPFACEPVACRLRGMQARPTLRLQDGKPFVTDEGNHIFDCALERIDDPAGLAAALAQIPGIVEHGLFVGYADILLIGRGDQVEVVE